MGMNYKYNFISADALFAKIALEMSSYFETGALNPLLFPIWTQYILDRLGKGSYPIREGVLVLENYEARLPHDFNSVREARLCTQTSGFEYRLPTSFYRSETYQMDHAGHIDRCAPCDPCNLCTNSINVVYKTDTIVCSPTYTVEHLLKPGNVSCLTKCDRNSLNRKAHSEHTFDINGNRFSTNFKDGEVFLSYYSSETDEEGTSLIPDNVKIIDAIEHYIKYKLFEMLWNQVTDETYNQIERKYQTYKQLYNEKFTAAEAETFKKTIYERVDAIKKYTHRNDRFLIK